MTDQLRVPMWALRESADDAPDVSSGSYPGAALVLFTSEENAYNFIREVGKPYIAIPLLTKADLHGKVSHPNFDPYADHGGVYQVAIDPPGNRQSVAITIPIDEAIYRISLI